MDDLIAFLRAQLDEQEAGIRQALRTEDWGITESDLVDVQAKRMLIDDAERDLVDDETDESAQWRIRVLALPYAGRTGYREEWRPTDG